MGLNLITTVEHDIASAALKVVAAGKYVESTVLPLLVKAGASATTVEAVTGLVDPALVNVEKAAYALLGIVVKSIQDAGAAATAGGVNISLDASVVADVKSIIPALKLPTATPATA